MITPYESAVELAEKLNRLAPGPTPKKAIFVTTGAEAVENTIKIARAHTGRSGVIAFGGGFHGRTFMAMALTGKVAPYKAGFGPFPGEVFHAPFPIAYHGVSVQDSLDALEHIFKYDIEPARVAAIIVEPVMGEGGFYIAPPEFLQALRKLCDQHGIVLVIDEIQTGFARTGKMFAIEHAASSRPDDDGEEPRGRFPAGRRGRQGAHHGCPGPGGLGGTYAGSPIACARGAGRARGDRRRAALQARRADRPLMVGTLLRAQAKTLPASARCAASARWWRWNSSRTAMRTSPMPDLTKALVTKRAARRAGAAVLRALRQRDPLPGAADGLGRDRERRARYRRRVAA
jgi:4-aminobutyrate aminotransferase / (S)-3-amino-2-methylpropionate transaminase / 5-aminovalerate transaminase